MSVDTLIDAVILRIDRLISDSISQIMHHPRIQSLESCWRGLFFLLQHHHNKAHVKIRLLNMSARELEKDLQQAIDIEHSCLFTQVYSQEFDQPGGTPYGLLIGNYQFAHQATTDFADPITTLGVITQIAASCFTPFIAAASPKLIGVGDFSDLPTQLDHRFWQMQEYQRWHQLRQQSAARFIGLCLPNFLLRTPFNDKHRGAKNRFFSERPKQHSDYLWGNAAFVYATKVIQSFEQTGWFNQTRGINPDLKLKPLNLCTHRHTSGDSALNLKAQCDLQLTSEQERGLSQAGLLPLYNHSKEQVAIFYHSQSLYQAPNQQDAQMNSMLHYVLAASRFAHYIKVIVRDRIGSFSNAQDCQHFLSNWIRHYCAASQNISADARLKYPLSQAQVHVQEMAQSPGKFICKLDIQPHDQADNLKTKLRLSTQLSLKLQASS